MLNEQLMMIHLLSLAAKGWIIKHT